MKLPEAGDLLRKADIRAGPSPQCVQVEVAELESVIYIEAC